MRFFQIVKQATKKNSKGKKSTNTKKKNKSKRNLKIKNKSKNKSKNKNTKEKKKKKSKKVKKHVYRGGNTGYSQYGSRPMHISYGMSKDSGISGNLANPTPYEITREFHL